MLRGTHGVLVGIVALPRGRGTLVSRLSLRSTPRGLSVPLAQRGIWSVSASLVALNRRVTFPVRVRVPSGWARLAP